jgi:hypothetical protein
MSEWKTIEFDADVTQEHINTGAIGMCTSCPVALAIRDSWPSTQGRIREVWVSSSALSVIDQDGLAWSTFTPDYVHRFLSDFDDCITVDPTVFHLRFSRVSPEED